MNELLQARLVERLDSMSNSQLDVSASQASEADSTQDLLDVSAGELHHTLNSNYSNQSGQNVSLMRELAEAVAENTSNYNPGDRNSVETDAHGAGAHGSTQRYGP